MSISWHMVPPCLLQVHRPRTQSATLVPTAPSQTSSPLNWPAQRTRPVPPGCSCCWEAPLGMTASAWRAQTRAPKVWSHCTLGNGEVEAASRLVVHLKAWNKYTWYVLSSGVQFFTEDPSLFLSYSPMSPSETVFQNCVQRNSDVEDFKVHPYMAVNFHFSTKVIWLKITSCQLLCVFLSVFHSVITGVALFPVDLRFVCANSYLSGW